MDMTVTSILEKQLRRGRRNYLAQRQSTVEDLRKLAADLTGLADELGRVDDEDDLDLGGDFNVLHPMVGMNAQIDRRGVGGALASLLAQARILCEMQGALEDAEGEE